MKDPIAKQIWPVSCKRLMELSIWTSKRNLTRPAGMPFRWQRAQTEAGCGGTYLPFILALRESSEGDHRFQASLGFTVGPVSKDKERNK